jgi:histidinol-phosphate aminotransferase
MSELRLNLNENAFGPSLLAVQAMHAAVARVSRYALADEALALQTQIAELECVAPAQVLLGDLLEPLGRLLAARAGGGEFVLSAPGYPVLALAAQALGGVAVEVPLNARLENDLPALAAAVNPRTQALFVVNPHNPSGTLSERGEFDVFVRDVASRSLVIVDEAYLDYQPDWASRSAARLLREGLNVLVFRTFDKLHALAGLQMGYVLAPLPLADALRRAGIENAHALNHFSLAAAAASLRDPAHLAAVREQVARQRDSWLQWLRARGWAHTQAAGNFVFFDSGRPHAEAAAALAAAGIIAARPFAPYSQWLRLAIGRPEDDERVRALLATFA